MCQNGKRLAAAVTAPATVDGSTDVRRLPPVADVRGRFAVPGTSLQQRSRPGEAANAHRRTDEGQERGRFNHEPALTAVERDEAGKDPLHSTPASISWRLTSPFAIISSRKEWRSSSHC